MESRSYLKLSNVEDLLEYFRFQTLHCVLLGLKKSGLSFLVTLGSYSRPGFNELVCVMAVVLRLSSPTLPFVSALGCSLLRTERRLPPSCPTMVA